MTIVRCKSPRVVDKTSSPRLCFTVKRNVSYDRAWPILLQSGLVKQHIDSCSKDDIAPSIHMRDSII